MTPQEIINEIQKLPPSQQKEVLDGLASDLPESRVISEAETAEWLLANGVIREIPEGWNKPDEDFEPIDIQGKPLSETLIEERR